MKFSVFASTLLLTFIACKNDKSKDHSTEECRSFNSQAVDSLMRYKTLGKKRATLESSLDLLNRAIECDSNLNAARFNKLSVLGEMGKYDEQINVVDDLFFRTKDSSLLMIKAGIYEWTNKKELSVDLYKTANKYFTRKLSENPQDASGIYYKILTQTKIYGRASVQPEIERYLAKFPDDHNLNALLTDTISLKDWGSRQVLKDGIANFPHRN